MSQYQISLTNINYIKKYHFLIVWCVFFFKLCKVYVSFTDIKSQYSSFELYFLVSYLEMVYKTDKLIIVITLECTVNHYYCGCCYCSCCHNESLT